MSALSKKDLIEISFIKYPHLLNVSNEKVKLQNANREAFINGYGFRKDETSATDNGPSADHVCQLLRDTMRTLNNLNVDSGTLIDRIKETMRMYASDPEDQVGRLVKSDSE